MTTNRDQRYQRRTFDKLAAAFSSHDFFHTEIRERLFDRLPLFRINPDVAVDLGGGTGEGLQLLRTAYPKARVFSIDSSAGMARQADSGSICAEALQLPFENDSIDMIVSNLMLHYCQNINDVLAEINRVLRPEGLLLFSMLGQDSLQELRSAWAAADRHQHVDTFADQHDVGDAMLHAGLREPVLDTEVLTITYEDIDKLLLELRTVATTRTASSHNPGLTGKQSWQLMRAEYEGRRNEAGQLPVTMEVIYGHAWGGTRPQEQNGEIHIPVSQLLGRGPRKMDTD